MTDALHPGIRMQMRYLNKQVIFSLWIPSVDLNMGVVYRDLLPSHALCQPMNTIKSGSVNVNCVEFSILYILQALAFVTH